MKRIDPLFLIDKNKRGNLTGVNCTPRPKRNIAFVYFFHSRGLKRIPHTRPQLHWRVLLLRAATLCCEYILHISEISLSFLSNYGPALNSVSNVFRPNATSVLVQRPRRKQTLCCGSQFKTEKSVFCSGEK